MRDDDQHLSTFGSMRQAKRRTLRGFNITLICSLLLHTAGVGAAVYVGRGKPAPRLDTAIPVQLVKLGKKRDPKLLPRRVDEPPPPPAEDAVKLDTSDKPPPPADPKEKQPTSPKEPEMSERARRLLEDTNLDRALKKVEDAEGDPEGDEFGTTTDTANAAAGYQREISRALQANYRLPESIPASQRQMLRARVVLFIERNGKIASYEFVERHPNTQFMGALEQLLSTTTLPPPPAAEAERMREAGIEVIFRP